MDSKIIQFLIVLVFVPSVIVGYILLIERVLKLVPTKSQARVRPWLWLAPALIFLFIFLIYPTINTFVLSFQDRASKNFIGLDNYAFFFTNGDTLTSLRNSLLWLVFLTFIAVGGGLLAAILFDRVRYEAFAKSLIFMPLAISFVGAGVIWKFMFEYRPPGAPQIGTLNAAVTSLGGEPIAWLQNAPMNTFMLIIVAAWIWTGFAMVILSAALKSISTELLEAARVDGATELQVFRNITFPLLLPTIAVVSTTMIITALKAFDIVYVMTNGAFDTEVVANRMYKELFNFGQPGRASAIAIILLLCTVPFMIYNIRRFRDQEAMR
ncbi:MAG: alpha-glucoside transport system permease protein [Chloroflexota bacterium]|jgi:alpha-glucoside transport system permease protein|nr:alpha-glucoside transport system permease protein [Chloroflexota bacterium]